MSEESKEGAVTEPFLQSAKEVEYAHEARQRVLDELAKPLEGSRVKTRSGYGGGKDLSYLESHDVIARLNQVFGFNGWKDSAEVTCLDAEFRYWKAIVVIEAKIGSAWVKHMDIGFASAKSSGGVISGDAIEMACKACVSDGMKRAARKFGDQFGNCLYDKDYVAEGATPGAGMGAAHNSQPQYAAPRPTPAGRPSATQGNDPLCPKCGKEMWCNIGKKTNPKAPDYKCKDKEHCDGVIWPPRDGEAQAYHQAQRAQMTPPDRSPASKELRIRYVDAAELANSLGLGPFGVDVPDDASTSNVEKWLADIDGEITKAQAEYSG